MDVDELLSKVDILEYISQYCELTKQNDGEWWGLSPLKEENTPSFSVNEEKQRFYDFSKGVGGNLINFIMEYHHVNFVTAVNMIKAYANITDDMVSQKRLETIKIAKKFQHKVVGVKEVQSNIVSDQYMNRFEFDKSKLKSWADEGISYDIMSRFDVKYDPLSNRIVFPIKDFEGNIINICGRTLDPDYKEKRLRKYTYFMPLGVLNTLYGFSDNRREIERKREIILFEGAKSVLLANGWGIGNSCAVLTSHLNAHQFLFLAKLGVRVVFALDKEINVLQDSQIMKLSRYTTVEYIYDRNNLLKEKMSPVDNGQDIFMRLYNERRRI